MLKLSREKIDELRSRQTTNWPDKLVIVEPQELDALCDMALASLREQEAPAVQCARARSLRLHYDAACAAAGYSETSSEGLSTAISRIVAERDDLLERLKRSEELATRQLSYDNEQIGKLRELVHQYMNTIENLREQLAEIQKTSCGVLLDNAVKTAAELRERLAEAEADARRYRALRDRNSVMTPRISDPLNSAVTYTPEGLDAALDKILASREPPTSHHISGCATEIGQPCNCCSGSVEDKP